MNRKMVCLAVSVATALFLLSSCTPGNEKEAPVLPQGVFSFEVHEESLLSARLADAELIIAGKILYTVLAEYERRQEGDPDWQWAVIAVKETLKGEHRPFATILFPKNPTGEWANAPQLAPRTEGLWVLLPAEARALDPVTSVVAFVAPKPNNFYALAHLSYLRSLSRR